MSPGDGDDELLPAPARARTRGRSVRAPGGERDARAEGTQTRRSSARGCGRSPRGRAGDRGSTLRENFGSLGLPPRAVAAFAASQARARGARIAAR